MAEQDNAEKTDPASQYKLEQARNKGSVAKSMEVNALVSLSVALLIAMAAGEMFASALFQFCRRIFQSAGDLHFEVGSFYHWSGDWMLESLSLLAPSVLMLMLAGVMASVMQTGLVLSAFPLKPDLDRLNPVSGFKRLFSMRMLYEAVKSVFKLALFSVVLYYFIKDIIPFCLMLMEKAPHLYPALFVEYGSSLAIQLLAVLLVVALADYLFVRWEFMKKMRMSKKEVKDEHKQRDGDPLVKAKQREIQKELRKRSSAVSKVPNADVIVTNPVHLAVLIKYDRKTMIAPIVLAKTSGRMVGEVRKVAAQHRVPVLENRQLARTLYRKVRADQPIPPDTYRDVAKLLSQAYALRRKRVSAPSSNRWSGA